MNPILVGDQSKPPGDIMCTSRFSLAPVATQTQNYNSNMLDYAEEFLAQNPQAPFFLLTWETEVLPFVLLHQAITNCPPFDYQLHNIKYFVKMNFFDSEFGFNSSPTYHKPPIMPPTNFPKANFQSDQVSKKSNRSAKKDDFDDLLDEMLLKEDRKNSRSKGKDVQPYSSTQLDFNPTPSNDFKKTQKWSTPNIDLNKNVSPRFPNSRINSAEDKSQDGRSFKSGITGRNPTFELDNLLTLRQPEAKDQPLSFQRSSRNIGMRPPLSKKELRQPKQPSVLNDDISIKFSRGMPESTTNLDIPDRPRRLDIKPPTAPEIKQRIIERQKVITVRQEATELKKQFENQIKEIKQSYQRQLQATKKNLKDQIEQAKRSKDKLIREYDLRIEQERMRQKKINEENTIRMNQLHQWELKKKEESYRMEVQKLKSLSRIEDSIEKQQSHIQIHQENIEIKAKERQIQLQKKKLDELKHQIQQRQKNLQFEEDNFQMYRKREEEKLQQQRRNMIEKQTQIKKGELQQKRSIAQEKQRLSNELAHLQIDLVRQKQALQLQKQEVRMGQELLDNQRGQFQQFNKNILQDYKTKLREVDAQKQRLNQLEIQLYKKIHTVEVVDQKRNTNTNPRARPQSVSHNQQNHLNKTNTQIAGLVQQTKDRFRDMQTQARRNALDTQQQRHKVKTKINVEGYITRMNRAMTRH